MANCDPSPALTSPLYQAATFDLCRRRGRDDRPRALPLVTSPHRNIAQTRELPPPSSYTMVTLHFIPDFLPLIVVGSCELEKI